ncbi:hypothetical protein D3C86_2091420 [compost metagenome]
MQQPLLVVGQKGIHLPQRRLRLRLRLLRLLHTLGSLVQLVLGQPDQQVEFAHGLALGGQHLLKLRQAGGKVVVFVHRLGQEADQLQMTAHRLVQ